MRIFQSTLCMWQVNHWFKQEYYQLQLCFLITEAHWRERQIDGKMVCVWEWKTNVDQMIENRKSEGNSMMAAACCLSLDPVIVLYCYQKKSHVIWSVSLEQSVLYGASKYYLQASQWFRRKTNIFSFGLLPNLWQLQQVSRSIRICCSHTEVHTITNATGSRVLQ